MANKNYFEFLDIPDGSGSTERWYANDAEAQANIAQVASAIGLDDFVDLGLPSGTMWAKKNIGAATETETGNFYMYGKGTTQYVSGDTPYAGTENPLDASKDTATQMTDGFCNMPTQAQIEELIANTTFKKVTNYKSSGVDGYTFTGSNGNSIFFPKTGYYNAQGTKTAFDAATTWSSTPEQMEEQVYDNLIVVLDIGTTGAQVAYTTRNAGETVRPVIKKSILELISGKADKDSVKPFASIQTCEDIIDELT